MHNLITKLIFCCAGVPLFFGCATVLAADNADLVKFARANKGKFDSEIVAINKVSVGSKVVVSGLIDINQFGLLEYDDKKQQMTFEFWYFDSFEFAKSCSNKGQFEGQNAFGAKIMVKSQECELYDLRDSRVLGLEIRNKRIPMTPSLFRQIKKDGMIQGEVDFIIKAPAKKTAVEYLEYTNKATIANPIQESGESFTINGRIDGVRVILPGTNEVITLTKPKNK